MDIRPETPRADRAYLGDVGPWHLRVSRGETGLLFIYAWRCYGDHSSATVTALGDTPSEAIASADRKLAPLAGDLASDIADGFVKLFDALIASELPPPPAEPVDTRIQVGPTDI